MTDPNPRTKIALATIADVNSTREKPRLLREDMSHQ